MGIPSAGGLAGGEDRYFVLGPVQGDGQVPAEPAVVLGGLLGGKPGGLGGVSRQGLGGDGDLVPVLVEMEECDGHSPQHQNETEGEKDKGFFHGTILLSGVG